MPASSRNLEEDVHTTLLTIKRLAPRAVSGWLSWRQVAKEQMGTEEYAVVLSSYATMEPYKQYFACDRANANVKLTEAGHRLVSTLRPSTLSETQRIADGVRQYAARLRRTSLTVTGVCRVAKVGDKFVQAFTVEDSEEAVASETPCEYRPKNGDSLTHGRIIGQEPDGSVLYVSLNTEVLPASLPGVLSIDRAYLLRALAERIHGLKSLPPRMVPVLRGRGSDVSVCVQGRDSLQLAEQLAALPTPWTRFLWGPPGAGKTYGLGYLVARLLCAEPNSKTLIVAPSNRAVDVAIEQVMGHVEKSEQRRILSERGILRFGYPRKPSLLDHPELLGSPELDELNRTVKRIAERIQKAERERGSQDQIAVIRAEMLAAQEAVKRAVAAHVQQCRVVATTVTLAYLNTSPIADYAWDNVIVDEVTMVTPAMCTFLASLAKKRFLLAGDPRQLGPVYEANARSSEDDYEWMGRDIFDKSGLSQGEGEAKQVIISDSRLAWIKSQRRCASPIWARIAHLYPGVGHDVVDEKLRDLFTLPPSPGEAVVLLDTSNCTGFAMCRNQYRSWENPFTAELALEVARAIAAQACRRISVAIIAPYRAQVRLLRKGIRMEQRALRSPLNDIDIDAGTVHQFQGSDADVIIFDMVDGCGRTKIGNLLRGDTGLRLVNVAFTRAKGKLILIADKKWCATAMETESNALLRQLVLSDPTVTRVNVLPRPDLTGLTQQKVGIAEQLLLDALCRRDELPDVQAGFIIRSQDGTAVACADLAMPQAKFAVYVDGPQPLQMGTLWQRDWRQRHLLAEAGWNFAVCRACEVQADPDAVSAEIATLYKRRPRQN